MKHRSVLLAGTGVLAITGLVMGPGYLPAAAESRISAPTSGHVALGLALRKLGVCGTFVQTPAHPDDEHNALHAMFAEGMGLRSIEVQATRGEGGQNEIGPELFGDMGVLRTSELLAAHRIDGAEQYFARAIDYGYSFDPQEVIGKWGRQEIVGDFVRMIRTFRPDVMLTMNIQGRGGDRAHEATTILTREAFRAAGDPAQFPEQIREGLRPWQVKKLYFTAGFGFGGGRGPRGGGPGGGPVPVAPPGPPAGSPPGVKLVRPNTAAYDALLGRTYAEIGGEARSNHKCQGMGGLPPLPGSTGGRGGGGAGYQLVETSIPGEMEKTEASLFDGIDTGLPGLARFAGDNPPAQLQAGLAKIADTARVAQQAFDAGNDAGTELPVETGLREVRTLRAGLASMGLSEPARYEIDFRLENKERDFQNAVLAAHGLTFDAVADDGLVIGGQPVKLTILAVNRGSTDITVSGVAIAGFETTKGCPTGVVKKDAVYTCSVEARIPQDAPLTTPYFTDEYWKNPSKPAINIYRAGVPFGVPFQPSPFRVAFHLKTENVAMTKELPVEYRYIRDTYTGDKRMELNVVPAFSVRMTPALAVVPASGSAPAGKPLTREVHVSITNGTKGKAEATVALQLPAGWKAAPASVPIRFLREDESLSARFVVTAPARVASGEYTLHASVTPAAGGDRQFGSGYQEIEYPHIQRRQVIKPAAATLKVVDVETVPHVRVGYVLGVGDQVPAAIEQLGANLAFIGQDELAWGDLSKYDVIVTGVRAYERRADLRAYNRRLLDYAAGGGAVIVQYNKMEFNQAEYGPYPAKVSGNRVSDETVPVKILAPGHPVFHYPNQIGREAWAGWVQERGLYFLGEKDAKYVDLVSMVDSYKDNSGEKLGSLVEGRVGKGRWIYLGLALWRQLPAGTAGSYQLLANLLALGKAPAGRR